VSTTLSCGQCGAPLRPDQSWCSLCYAHIPEEFDPLTAPLDEVMGHEPPSVQPLSVEFVPDPEPIALPELAPILQDPIPVPEHVILGDDVTEEDDGEPAELSDVDVMLSMLAAEHKAMDPAAGLMDRFDDKSTRVAIMVGGTVLIGAFLFVGLTVLGAIF
jgi:hypothetical protein